MDYFKIRQPSDKKVIGINDGGEQAEIIESKWKNKKELQRYTDEYILGVHRTLERLENGENVAPPAFEYIKVRPKAILTDFLSFSEGYNGGRFLISDKVKKLVEKFNVPCRIYPNVPLFQFEEQVKDYSNLHLLPLKVKEVVEFKDSILFNGTRHSNKVLRYANSYADYLKLGEEGKLLNFELLNLKQSKVNELDFLSFDTIGGEYVSERLKKAMEAEGVTGIKYLEPEEPRLVFS